MMFVTAKNTNNGNKWLCHAVAIVLLITSVFMLPLATNTAGDTYAMNIAGSPPFILAPTPVVIPVNPDNKGNLTRSDLMNGVLAYDQYGNDLTGNVRINPDDNNNDRIPPIPVDEEGVYSVTYRVNDADENRREIMRAVVVDGGSFAIGNDYILKAGSFTIRSSEVTSSDAQSQLLSKSGARAWNMMGEPAVAVVNDTGAYSASKGDYFPVIGVHGTSQISKQIQVTVDAGNPPTLNVPTFKQVTHGSVFGEAQYMDGVSAIDEEDDVITDKVVYDTPVNANKIGAYKVTYSVTDSDGNTTEKYGIVLVGGSWLPIGYAITAHDFSKNLGQVTGTDDEMIDYAGARALDVNPTLSDGNPNPNYGMPVPVVVSDPGGYQTQRAGTFNITFAVEADPEMTFTITATVDAGKPPVLNVPAVKYPPYGSVFGEAQYMEGVSAIDDEDGVITGKVIYDTPVNTNTAGAYRVTYSVTDSDGNTTEKSGMVLVSSWDPPINYGIFAHDFSKNLGQVTGTNAEMINSADAKAIDLRHILSDGSPNPNYGKPTPVVVWDTGGYQAQRAGIFKITFAVQDDLNTRFTITAIVGADDNQFTPNVNPDNESIDESTEEPIEESTDELIDESTTELTDEDTIDLAALPSRAFEIADKTWTGKQIKSDLKIAVSYQVNGASVTKTLNAGADYTITNYGVNRNIGNATVTIEGNAGSDYTGEKTLSFRIVPTKPTELKLEAGVKSIKVGFKKVSAEQDVKTYRIDYRVKGAKKWTSITASVKSTGNAGKKQTASVTLKKLKQKKTYEVRVYAYKGAYKSPPTSVKSIKTK